MKSQLSIVLLIGLLSLIVIAASVGKDAAREDKGVVRRNIRMPKLFSMGVYMEKFHKKYPNAAELMRRTKLFTARAFSVFVSSIKYMYNRSTKYLKLNPRSDWTRAERRASLNHFASEKGKKKPNAADTGPAVDPKVVEELVRDPSYAQLAAQLGDGSSRRRKRDATEKRRRTLTMEQLTGEAREPSRVSPKYASHVESNNPDYEQPQLGQFSEGASINELRSIPEAEARKIDQVAAVGSYLGGLISGIKQTAMDSRTSWAEKLQLLASAGRSNRDVDMTAPREPDEVMLDYRHTGCLLEPKNQFDCGSCYIFAATTLLEWQHCNQTGKLVPFSEQYAVDCGRASGLADMYGCDGGVDGAVGLFYAQFGLEMALDYPYKGEEQSCPFEPSASVNQFGHTKIDLIENNVIRWTEDGNSAGLRPEYVARLLEQKGPLIVTVRVNDEFDDFGGGVDQLDCDPEDPDPHSMVLIGHGREDGLEYYLLRNSHGTDFGLGGHYKMAKRVKEGCLLRVSWTLARFTQNRKRKGSPNL